MYKNNQHYINEEEKILLCQERVINQQLTESLKHRELILRAFRMNERFD